MKQDTNGTAVNYKALSEQLQRDIAEAAHHLQKALTSIHHWEASGLEVPALLDHDICSALDALDMSHHIPSRDDLTIPIPDDFADGSDDAQAERERVNERHAMARYHELYSNITYQNFKEELDWCNGLDEHPSEYGNRLTDAAIEQCFLALGFDVPHNHAGRTKMLSDMFKKKGTAVNLRAVMHLANFRKLEDVQRDWFGVDGPTSVVELVGDA